MEVGPDRRMRPNACLNCGKELDSTTMVSEEKIGPKTRPSPGDFTICIECGHLMVFTKKMRLRNPTDAEILKVAGDKRMMAIQTALAAIKKLVNVKKGDTVELTVDDRTVEALVLLASPNGRSLVLGFEAILDGHVGKMPIFNDDKGTYRALITGKEVQIAKKGSVQ